MAKKSQKRPLRYEKNQTGCISGLISIFDFRHGRSTRKLLSDKRWGSRQVVGSVSSRSKAMLPRYNERGQDTEDDTESGMASAETAITSVKKLMEEEMCNEQSTSKHANDREVGQEIFCPEHGCHARKNCKQTIKSSKRTNDINLCDAGVAKDLVPDQANAVDEGKLSAAVKIFLDHCSSNIKHSREDGQNQQSAVFVDASDRLSSKKDMLLKLLQDPNSLLVKQIKGLESAQLERDWHSNSLPRSGFLEEKLKLSKTDELINHKHDRKFFQRTSKSQERFPSVASEKCQSSSKIVILKPGPAALRQNTEINVSSSMHSDYPEGNKIQGERNQFSFAEIKRKLKHAIRKEKQVISSDGITCKTPLDHQKRHDFEKGVGRENVGWRSPNRNHFYTERYAKPSIQVNRGDKIVKPNDTVAITTEHAKPRVSNIYLEAKKHLLEMLSSGDDDVQLNSQQLPKSLGKILSFYEYSCSPKSSPRNGSEDCSVAAERTLSSRGGIGIFKETTNQLVQENLDDHLSSLSLEIESSTTHVNPDEKAESLEATQSLPCERDHANLEEENLSAARDAIVSEGATGIKETANLSHENSEISDVASQFDSSFGMGDGDVAGECHEDTLRQSLKMESSGECQTVSSPSVSPSHSSINIKVEDFESAINRTERPSPVSVLEPLFIEDDISPARTISRPVELEIQPRQIHFEEGRSSNDQEICMQCSPEDEVSAFEYVEAVLLGSGLAWDEYLVRWLSSSPILDSILYEEVELFPGQSRHEQRLLFDCTSEVLEEACDRYFGCFPLMSNSKQNIRPVPTRMNLIREIWEGVEWYLLQYPQPQTLDQLLKKDMAKSRTWMDLQVDIRHIGAEMEETIFDSLVEDTIKSFIYDALESDLLASPADLVGVNSIHL